MTRRATPLVPDMLPKGTTSAHEAVQTLGAAVRRPEVGEMSDADVAEGLFAEFESVLGLSVLSDVVRRCRVVRRVAPTRSSSRGGAASLDDLAREAIAATGGPECSA